MFTIKNKDSISHTVQISGPTFGIVQISLDAGQIGGPYPESWREYFLQNEVHWAVVFPKPEDSQEKSVVIQSIGAIETEPPAAKVKPRQYKKRSK
ncbi:MAG TPA: hypothetical protein PLG50_10995 [bacterium]|nr:hypothetical protein [bacterium]HQG46172.1 hypothetical protein [bacterium]HQJ66298.1 hypothetical protein [bacterium]